MTAALNRPDWGFWLALNADPNDPAAVPTWSDFTDNLRSASALARGRQFELGTTLAADPSVVVRDVSELLNPENTSSTFYGNILPERQSLWLGLWPNIGSSTASAGNLLNTATWRVPYDCSFESYATGAAVAWITAVGGTAPVVGTSTPHGGSRDLTYAVVNGATVQGVSWQLPCMPGRQYTVSAYVRQSSASTQGIYVDGVVGTTTTTTGAYVRLTATFTATQDYHTAAVRTSGTAVAGTVLVDDIQHEQGAAATTATTTGSVIYPVLRNYVEAYNRTWDSNGFEGVVSVPCVDAIAALSSIRIPTEYVAAALAADPDFYYPLAGTAPATGLAYLDLSGNNFSPLTRLLSKYGLDGNDITPGEAMDIVGDPGSVGANFKPPSVLNSGKGAILANGQQNPSAGPFSWPPTGSTWAASMAVWIQIGGVGGADAQTIATTALTASGGLPLTHIALTVTTANVAEVTVSGLTNQDFIDGTTVLTDGLPHLVVGTVTQASGGNTVAKVYVDGALEGSITLSTSLLGGALNRPSVGLMVGGFFAFTAYGQMLNGSVAHLAGWSRELSAADVTALWQAGGLGFAGETSGARVARHLALGGYAGRSRISAGSTTMGPPTYTPTIDLQTDTTNSAVAEGGMHWVAPDAAVVFEGRQDRWLRLTPTWILGERVDLGEIPYEGDIQYSYDAYNLYANVTETRNNGATATGGSVADVATAGKRFFGRAYEQNSDFATDQQAQDKANWDFYTHNRPATRIARIPVRPSANPTLWAFALGVECGQRIRVNRRPKAANSGAGITVSLDFFVENVTHDLIDMDTGEWVTILLCSPIGSVTSQTGVTFQPWIVEDATYGQLDVTAVLGW